jgi:hypothetical protein
MVSKRVKHNTNVEGGHSQGNNFVALAWSQSVSKHNTNVEGGHSQGNNFVALAWSQSV